MLCSGKVAYDLMEARNAAGDNDTAIVRLEQLYPFPGEPLVVRLKRMTNLEEVVWAQEEPKNAGSWSFVDPFIEECLGRRQNQTNPRALCRAQGQPLPPQPALQSAIRPNRPRLVADALGHNVRAEIRRQRKG